MSSQGTQPAHLNWTDASGVYQTFTFDLVQDEQWSLGSDVTKHPVEVGANIADNIRVRLRRVVLKVTATNEPVAASYWSTASARSAGNVVLTNQKAINVASAAGAGAVTITPGDGVIDAPDWDSQLQARILAGTAAGLIGSAAGGQGGPLGAIAGAALAGALLPGVVVDRAIQTDAPSFTPTWPTQQSITPTVLTFDTPGDFVGQTIALLETFNQTGQTIDVVGSKSACLGPAGIGGMAITDLTHSRNQAAGTGADITITLEELRIVFTVTVPAPKPTDSTKPVSRGNQGTFNMEADVASQAADDAAGPFAQGRAAGQAAGEQ